ncbi:hypothetical protein [Lentzea atacamensis]|uniref:hypothetical protein n=1 Tax=Lentzea atacamensis TaxID=531938 RepID=UPI000DD49070|nr:hypothetical protein [Lentzea atacamensis]
MTAFILVGLVASLLVRTAGNAVTDGFAAAKGKTPPSQKRWEAREAERRARGEKPKEDPGYFGRWFANAVEEQTVKAAQKHKAKMEILEEDERDNVDAHKAKYREQQARKKARAEAWAAAWDQAGETFAGWWSSTPWDDWKETVASTYEAVKEAAKKAASKAADGLRERRDEKAAWDANEAFDDDEDARAAAADPTVLDGEVISVTVHNGADDDLAPVIPLYPELPTGTDTDGSTTMATSPTAVTEITDLETAKIRVTDSRDYLVRVEGQLADLLATVQGLFNGVTAEASSTENDKGAVKTLGFKENTKVVKNYGSAIEDMNALATKLGQVLTAVKETGELGATARAKAQTLLNSFVSQDTVAETVGAAAATTGVADKTDFYGAVAK